MKLAMLLFIIIIILIFLAYNLIPHLPLVVKDSILLYNKYIEKKKRKKFRLKFLFIFLSLLDVFFLGISYVFYKTAPRLSILLLTLIGILTIYIFSIIFMVLNILFLVKGFKNNIIFKWYTILLYYNLMLFSISFYLTIAYLSSDLIITSYIGSDNFIFYCVFV
jgi:hypothetical protein